MSKKIVFSVLSIIVLSAFQMHKHYVSLCEVVYKEDKKAVQVVTSLFTDDFEKAVLEEINPNFDIDSSSKETDKNCNAYLSKHLQFEIDGKKYNYNYLGKEFDGRKVFFYVEITDVLIEKQLKIKNSLLVKQFPRQKNVVKVKMDKKIQSFYLNKDKTELEVSKVSHNS